MGEEAEDPVRFNSEREYNDFKALRKNVYCKLRGIDPNNATNEDIKYQQKVAFKDSYGNQHFPPIKVNQDVSMGKNVRGKGGPRSRNNIANFESPGQGLKGSSSKQLPTLSYLESDRDTNKKSLAYSSSRPVEQGKKQEEEKINIAGHTIDLMATKHSNFFIHAFQ